MKNLPKLLGGIAFLSLMNLMGCEISNPEEIVPSVITIEDAVLDNSDVRDVWVNVGTESMGVFPLPATVPVFQSGEKTLTIFYGIIENGITSLRAIYPFWKSYQVDIDLVEGETTEIGVLMPAYRNDLEIRTDLQNWDSGSNITLESILGAPIEEVDESEGAFEGGSGKIRIDSTHTLSTSAFFLKSETPDHAYMEMNYKLGKRVFIFVAGFDDDEKAIMATDQQVSGLLERDSWNKAYINLRPTLNLIFADPEVTQYKIYFRSALEAEETAKYNYYDNIKILRER